MLLAIPSLIGRALVSIGLVMAPAPCDFLLVIVVPLPGGDVVFVVPIIAGAGRGDLAFMRLVILALPHGECGFVGEILLALIGGAFCAARLSILALALDVCAWWVARLELIGPGIAACSSRTSLPVDVSGYS